MRHKMVLPRQTGRGTERPVNVWQGNPRSMIAAEILAFNARPLLCMPAAPGDQTAPAPARSLRPW